MEDKICGNYTLGLDIGIASVGAALLLKNQILGLHVRTFEKAETGEGESLNKARREARLVRRCLQRRALRMLTLLRLMKREGLVQQSSKEYFAEMTRGLFSPWQLRVDGLDRLLQPAEWAAVIYHILKHRGFHSTRKSEILEDKKLGKMLTATQENQALKIQKNYRTIGELIYRDEKFIPAKRNKSGNYQNTILREELIDELKQLFCQQRALGNVFISSDFEEQVDKLLRFRKPALSGDALISMVGNCTFEHSEKRAPKASYSAERFVWLTKLNNLRLFSNGKARALSNEERRKLLEQPFLKTKLTYKQVRKILRLSDNEQFRLSYGYTSDGKEKKPEEAVLFEAKYFHFLRKIYEEAGLSREWNQDCLNNERIDAIGWILSCYKEDNERWVELAKLGIENNIIEALLSLSFNEFIHLSLKALKKIITRMEDGLRYDEAVAAIPEYKHHSQLSKSHVRGNYLPCFDENKITNPVEVRAVNQARKLVNAIIKKYGPPASVYIEFAPDLSKSRKEREEMKKGQDNFKREKEEGIKGFEEHLGAKPTGEELKKYLLYREQDGQCAYSLMPIDLARLQENGYVEIDHILPFSRSFDDTKNNKVLVLTCENRNKGNCTPYEYLDGANESERWRKFEASVYANKKIRKAKRDRLLGGSFLEEEAKKFRERYLSDTRYICKLFKNHIEMHLNLEKKQCVVVSGEFTGFLRARWGLSKNRDNGDLRHALDAAVVAVCSRSMVQRVATYSRCNELQQLQELDKRFPQPWPDFRKELMTRLSAVRVSRMPTRRGMGAAHQETIRSIGGKSRRLIQDGYSAVRTPLHKLKKKDLENMVGFDDPRNKTLINAICERLDAYGDDGKKAFGNNNPLYRPGRDPKISPIVRTVKLKQKQKSGLEVRGGIADNATMLRIDVFTKSNKFYVIPVYVADAVRDVLPTKVVVQGKSESEWEVVDASYTFLFSLYRNDWVRIETKKQMIEGYFSEFDRSTSNISIYAHDRDFRIGVRGKIRGIGIKTAISVEKYHVDLLGQLYKTSQEIRAPLRKTKRPLIKEFVCELS